MTVVAAIGLGSLRDAIFAVIGFGVTAWLIIDQRQVPHRRVTWAPRAWVDQPLLASVVQGCAMATLAEGGLLLIGNPLAPVVLNPLCAVGLGATLGIEVYRRLRGLAETDTNP